MSSSSRYDRQTRLPMIGQSGQQLIRESRVAVLGCGALGTVAADILARAGVGFLRLIDRDVVEWTNLQRQSLFLEADAEAGRAKAEVACERLRLANSAIELEPIVADASVDTIASMLADIDLVIDAADNFAIRFLLNDYSLQHRIPWVHGGCVGTSGQVMFFTGQGKPCFRCLVPQMPPAAAIATCDTAGVLGSATHAIASLQATEALKWLSGHPEAIRRRVWSIDFWGNRNREVDFPPELCETCPACARGEYSFLEGLADETAGEPQVLCGRQAVQLPAPPTTAVSLDVLARRWRDLGAVQSTKFFVRLTLPDQETLTVFRDGRTVVDGTDDVAKAKSLHARFVGG